MTKKLTQSEIRRKALVLKLIEIRDNLKARAEKQGLDGDIMAQMAEAIGTTRETLSRWVNWHTLPTAHVPAIERYLERMQ